jgi:hypothetical protein
MGAKRNAYRILEGKAGRKETTRWEGNIEMDHREIEWGGMDWIYVAQDRDYWGALVNTVMHLRVP